MTNDKELVEAWCKQFEEWAHDYPGDALSKEYLKQAWIASKISQPSVVLPKREKIVMDQLDAGYNMGIDCCAIALTAAGIKYTIGE